MLEHDDLVSMLQTFYFLSLFPGTRTWQSEKEMRVDLLIWLHFELSNIRRFPSDNLKQKQVWTCWYDFILNFRRFPKVTIWNRNKCGLVDMTCWYDFILNFQTSGNFRVLQHSLQNKYTNSHTRKCTKTTHFGWHTPPPHKPCYAQHCHTNLRKHTQLSPKSLYLYMYLFNSLIASFSATAQS